MFLFYGLDVYVMTTVNASGVKELYFCYYRDCEQPG